MAGMVAATAITYATRRTIPRDAEPVAGFELDKYLGTWFEIARFDFRFERKLTNVTALYLMNEDGSVKVINRGYNPDKNRWEEAEGKAVFVSDPDVAMLKVSFFGPFYSGYNVMAIDPEYRYALVFGRNLDYMWLLSRDKTMPKSIEKKYLDKAAEAGYDLSSLIWTEQD